MIQRKKLCFNCLGKHQANSCRSTHRRNKCKRKHHTSLCDQSNENRSQTSVSSLSAEAPSFTPLSHVSQVTNSSTDSSEHATILHSVTQSRNNLLLKTAVAMVTSGSDSAEANILFDEGTQRSFITRDLADKLNLQRLGSEVVHLAAIGAESKTVGHFDTARVYLITDHSEKSAIDVLIVPTIAVPVRNQIRATAHLHY